MLQEALNLSTLGWKVFALGPTGHPFPNCRDCKTTCTTAEDYERCDHLTCHATYAGTNDPDRLAKMWNLYPHALIGVRTGAASGLFVLDFDVHGSLGGSQSLKRLIDEGSLFRTVTARTGGGGIHMYYRHPMTLSVPNDNRGKLGPGADVKGDGGFVIAPPCAKRGKGAYSWVQGCSPWDRALACLPTSIMLTITKSNEKPAHLAIRDFVTQSSETRWAKWNDALSRVEYTGVGSRNENLYRAACRGGEMIAAGLMKTDEVTDALEGAGKVAGLTPSEIRQTIRSGMNRGHLDVQKDPNA